MGHYFINDDNLKSEIKEFKINFFNTLFNFKTDNGVFSKGELDYGTYLLLKNVLTKDIFGKVLDLGCGYGSIGIIVAKLKNCLVTMSDINNRALHLTNLNIKDNKLENVEVLNSDGFSNISKKFNFIITNPPIRVGKEKLYSLLKEAKLHLETNGLIYLVIRKEQGAKSFIRDMSLIYQVEVIDKSKGFYIISLKCC